MEKFILLIMSNSNFKNTPSDYNIPLEINGCKPNGLQFRTMQHFLPSEASLRLAVIANFVVIADFLKKNLFVKTHRQTSEANLRFAVIADFLKKNLFVKTHRQTSEANLRFAVIAHIEKNTLFVNIYKQKRNIPLGMFLSVEKNDSKTFFIPLGMKRSVKSNCHPPTCIPLGMHPIINTQLLTK